MHLNAETLVAGVFFNFKNSGGKNITVNIIELVSASWSLSFFAWTQPVQPVSTGSVERLGCRRPKLRTLPPYLIISVGFYCQTV